jgi:ABC-type branched-subunit amino acid transport system substrate-binding protein
VVGGIFSITGPASYLGEPERNTMQMMAAEINAKGGINGHPVKAVIYDDEATSPRPGCTPKNWSPKTRPWPSSAPASPTPP